MIWSLGSGGAGIGTKAPDFESDDSDGPRSEEDEQEPEGMRRIEFTSTMISRLVS